MNDNKDLVKDIVKEKVKEIVKDKVTDIVSDKVSDEHIQKMADAINIPFVHDKVDDVLDWATRDKMDAD